MENIPKGSNPSLYIVQRDTMFLGIDMAITIKDDIKNLMDAKPIFKNIYKYQPGANNTDYFHLDILTFNPSLKF